MKLFCSASLVWLLATVGCHQESNTTATTPSPTKETDVLGSKAPALETSQPETSQGRDTTSEPTRGQEFLKMKIEELDSFKDTDEFFRLGFGVGGPYNTWLTTVEAESHSTTNNFSRSEGAACGHLMQMGLDYAQSRGKETEYTRFARQEIKRVIESKPE